MLSILFFSVAIILVTLIIVLGVKRNSISLYWQKVGFYFRPERTYYHQLKQTNKQQDQAPMHQKKLTVVIKHPDVSCQAIIESCGICSSNLVDEIITESYTLILSQENIIFVIAVEKLGTSKHILRLRVLLDFFAKKIRTPLLLIQQDEIISSKAKNKEEGMDDALQTELNNHLLQQKRIKDFLLSSRRALPFYIKWLPGFEKLPGFEEFKQCTNGLFTTIPSYINATNKPLNQEVSTYFNSIYRELAKQAFLSKTNHFAGACVFLKQAEYAIKEKLSSSYRGVVSKEIIFLNMRDVNGLTPLNFIKMNQQRSDYLYISAMTSISIISITILSYLISDYQKYYSWAKQINKSISESNKINIAQSYMPLDQIINQLGLSWFYPTARLTQNINNHIAKKFIDDVLIPKIKIEQNLYKKAFLILLTSRNDRRFFIENDNLITDYLGLSEEQTAFQAFLESDIKIDNSLVPNMNTQDIEKLKNHNGKEILSSYKAYFTYLSQKKVQGGDYQNFITFVNEYGLPIRIGDLIYKTTYRYNLSDLSTKNKNFLKLLIKQDAITIKNLVSPNVLTVIRSVTPLKKITVGKFINDIDKLIYEYKIHRSSSNKLDINSAKLIRAALEAYIATYSEYMITHSITTPGTKVNNELPIVFMKLSKETLEIPVYYTLNYYVSVYEKLKMISDIKQQLKDLGFSNSDSHLLELKKYINLTYIHRYILAYDNLRAQLGSMNLLDQPANRIMQKYALPDSQFYSTLKEFARNTTFSKNQIKENPELAEINQHFEVFNKVITNKKLIQQYQVIIQNMQTQYQDSKNANESLVDTLLTFIKVPNKSPLLKIEDLLKANEVPLRDQNIFTLPVTQVLASLQPYLYQYLKESWHRNITPEIIMASAYYPFNTQADKTMDVQTMTKVFGPKGQMNNFIDTAYLPFLYKKNNQYHIKFIKDKDLPKDIKQILEAINSYKKLSSQLWDKNGLPKKVPLTILPIALPEQVVNEDDELYIGASYFNLNQQQMINLPQQQRAKILQYDWSAESNVASVGWLDDQGDIHPLASEQGSSALFLLLEHAKNHKKNTYKWDIHNSKLQIGFTLNSPLFQFIQEIRDYDTI